MKAIIAVFILSISILAQVEDDFDFFPLQVGNLWLYINLPENDFWETRVVAADTVWADSSIEFTTPWAPGTPLKYKKYFNDRHTLWWNIDTEWSVCYKFDAPINSAWLSYPSFPLWTVYKREFNDLVFGNSVIAREYWETYDTNSTLATSHYMAEGIGLYRADGELQVRFLLGCIIDGKVYGTLVSTDRETVSNLPTKFLLKNFPNPFNGQTIISYNIPFPSHVIIKVYDILGNEIQTLLNEEKSAGTFRVLWQPKDLSSGIYIAVLQTQNIAISEKLVYQK